MKKNFVEESLDEHVARILQDLFSFRSISAIGLQLEFLLEDGKIILVNVGSHDDLYYPGQRRQLM